MTAAHYDVVIVGAGPAGITAAIALARAEVPVLVIEAGVFPGAENWSGAVYFTENLAQPDVLGEAAVRESAFERPVTRRGVHLYDGHSLAGLTYRNPATFAHSYTVLRPTYDQYLAELAKSFGAAILTETTVDGLLRDDQNRIVGVHTDRGPIAADVVFLAEGDASQLVSKEGYERCREPGSPHFLQGIAEIIELDPGEIERRFDLPPGEGAAYELVLRNGSLHNRPVPLNLGGFVYTNAASVSVGLVLPLANFATEFDGDHNRLMEWFKALPEIQRWTDGGRSVAYGAKIIRGGGYRELPQLVDDGLAVGGAATGIGIDFPYPNFTGPATAMGRIFAHAVTVIRGSDRVFSRARLAELYESPLRQTHYFQNVEFLQDWPHYVEQTRVFFGRAVDLATGSLHIAGHPDLHAGQKLWQLSKFLRETLPPKHWREFFGDLRAQRAALGLDGARLRGSATKTRNQNDPIRDTPSPVGERRVAPEVFKGEVRLEFRVDGQDCGRFLWPISRCFRKLPGSLRESADHLYRNDEVPIPQKLRRALDAARRHADLGTVLAVAGFGLLLLALAPVQWICELVKLAATRPSPEQYLSGFFQRTRALVRRRCNLDPGSVAIGQSWDQKLALVTYHSSDRTHIKVRRKERFPDRAEIQKSPLWHVCPAQVYECHPDDLGQSQLVVSYENCIKCETCWRAAPDDVDWTRQRGHRLVFSSPTESNRKLLELLQRAPARTAVPVPQTISAIPAIEESSGLAPAGNDPGRTALAARLRQFSEAVYAEPRYLDAGRIRWLLSLLERARANAASLADPGIDRAMARILGHAARRKFFWAEADARQLLDDFATGTEARIPVSTSIDPATDEARRRCREKLDELFPRAALKDLEHGTRLTPDQTVWLKEIGRQLAAGSTGHGRSDVLRELARKDPSLALLVAGIAYAQVTARPDLADIPWIGLNTARVHGREFPPAMMPRLPEVAADLCAIAAGAGAMLLERCRAHAVTRVQFPGLFRDEDGRDGIAKFGAVKRLLSQMEAQVYLLEALRERGSPIESGAAAAMVKIIASESFGPEEGSLAYNAGQIIGGSAYSEDDIFSKFYRDSTCLSRLLFDDEDLKRQIGPDADTRLRAFALESVRTRAGEDPTEVETEILRYFTEGAAGRPVDGVDRRERRARAAALGADLMAGGYPEGPLDRLPPFDYRAALEVPQGYDHGDFLVRPFDSSAWRYVPEMLFADPELRAGHERLLRHFTDHYWNARFEGLPYHRWVERLHQVPLADVRDMVARGFTRMYIPRDCGGEHLLKAHYYILCSLSMRYADPSYALTIMAHASIGTTPILIALSQDLPRANKDLQEFLADQSEISHLQSQITTLLRLLDSPRATEARASFTALGEKIRSGLGKKPMLRAVAGDFLANFQEAGRAGLKLDLARCKELLRRSRKSLESVPGRAKSVVAELDRRAESARLYLKLISAGQISAFALTEPNAGSDSGGVQTRATLKRVEVLTDPDGGKYFLLGTDRKNLLDASRLEFDFSRTAQPDAEPPVPSTRYQPPDGAVLYRYADDQPPSPIRFDAYDYATDDPSKFRYYLRDGKRIDIHDIAQIRTEPAAAPASVDPTGSTAGSAVREYYEYYELNGAKMWITNGHVAGIFCLYARATEGPTGFLVDRHSEGLVVGRDEEKTGQRGSPTNELSLTGVRVPRENVIGIEGRGQVNALETLNVGRTGLCVTAAAMTAKIIEQTRAFAIDHGLEREPWVRQLLGEMVAEHYAVESLAFELVGRFDHPGTRSVRVESAIGKYYASEALHRAIRSAERIYGIEGITALHELEKHRRDARVLNIYEGTNEVQRFLILRDLVDVILPKWKDSPDQADPRLDDSKSLLRRAAQSAVAGFGPQVWQNAGFQATMFKLADMAGYILAMDSALWRVTWLRSQIADDATEADRRHRHLAESAAGNYLEDAARQVRRLHAEFERDLTILQEGVYPPETRIAFLALQAAERRPSKPVRHPLPHAVARPWHVVVVLDVEPVVSPHPRASGGALLETDFRIEAAARTALQRAVELKRAANRKPFAIETSAAPAVPPVRITAVAVAPRYGVDLLRRAVALGADRAVLLETGDLPDDVHGAARIVADHIALNLMPCDLVLCGDPLLGAALAGNLGFDCFDEVDDFLVSGSKRTVRLRTPPIEIERTEPLVLALVADDSPDAFNAADYLHALGRPVEVVDARGIEAAPRFPTRFALAAPPATEDRLEATPEAAAVLVRKLAGVDAAGGEAGSRPFDGRIELVDRSALPLREAAVLVATPGRLENGVVAAACAEALGLPLTVMVLGDPDEPAMRRLVSEAGSAATFCFVTHAALADSMPGAVLAALQNLWKDRMPTVVMAGAWANGILVRFARTFPRVQGRYNVSQTGGRPGQLDLAWAVWGGKVRRAATIAAVEEHPLVLTFATDVAGLDPVAAPRTPRVTRLPLAMEYAPDAEELAMARASVPAGGVPRSIADAAVLIDVGYAVRTREQFDSVVLPLKRRLEEIGIRHVMIGGTRKVVEELKLLAPAQQIGQTGVSVNPQLVIALGVSGAPQHIDYIGDRATIVAFNRDSEAPLITLNRRRARPKVVPLIGDLYELAPRFMEALKPKSP